MDSLLDITDMRPDEFRFSELVLADVKRYFDTFVSQDKRNVVLVFPALSPRNRRIARCIVQRFFHGLDTISVGSNNFGRRLVVHHASRVPKFCETELKSSKTHNENHNEMKAQEKISKSLMPKKLDTTLRSSQHKRCKRPDIPIYTPKALWDFDGFDTYSTNKSSDSKQMKGSISLYSRNQPNNSLVASLDLFKFIDLSTEKLIHDNEFKTLYNDNNISESLASTILPDSVKNINERYSNSFEKNEIIKINNPNLEHDELDDHNIIEMSTNLTDCKIADTNDKITPDHVPVTQQTIKSMDLNVDDNISDMSNKQLYEKLKENKVIDSSVHDIELQIEYDSNCPHYSVKDSFMSGSLIDKDENFVNEEFTVQQNPVLVNKSLETLETDKKKKVLDVDEYNWKDMYDTENVYMHPLLMKELVSTLGHVDVQCTKEDYRSHQTIRERLSDNEYIIEVYGFSPDLKTIDLKNQFAKFGKNCFKIIWVDDTHALAVFETPNIADRALNMQLALVKTRALKNAIKESKIRAAKVVPLKGIRPLTCTASVRRLVSNALGLKVNVSPDSLNAEHILLADAKERKIQDAQQKHSKKKQ